MEIENNGNLVLGPFDESTPCLMMFLMNCQTKLRINHLTAVKSVAILEKAPYPPIIEDTTIQIVQGDPFTARANEPKRLHCLARKGNPPATLKWFLNDIEITTNVNQTNVRDLEKRKTWQAVSALDMTFTKEDNHKMLKCVAIHDAYDTKAKDIIVQLEILCKYCFIDLCPVISLSP
ncbi:kin of IRRE-like protein 1 [Trichonephila clavipes]|nr:kin of IRRE-like protein 1 [Trichonephila clavipes]